MMADTLPRLQDALGDRYRVDREAGRGGMALPPRFRTLLQFHEAYDNGEFRRARDLMTGLIAHDSTDDR